MTEEKNTRKISVIMAVYNERPDLLAKSIESILNQSFINFEFIVINDGMDEETLNMLETYCLKDSRIILLNNSKHIGLTKSLNIAIKKSKGEFIARMDSDDVSLPNRFEEQLNYLLNNKFDLIGSNCDFVDNNGKFLKSKHQFIPKDIKKRLIKGNFFTHSTLLGKRKIFEELYNENFRRSQDYEFLLRVISKGYKVGYLEKCLLLYRINDKGVSLRKAKQQEWFAIKARWLAIRKYNYSFFYIIYFVKPLISFLLPVRLKHFIIFNLFKSTDF